MSDNARQSAEDERVTAAALHWAPRFVANGTDFADVQATMSRISRWEDWCREWGRTGQAYEDLAGRAEAEGHLVTAGGAWRRAALCWHWGKFLFVERPAEQRAAHERTVYCFSRGAATLSPPAERVTIPYEGTALAALLRIPDTVAPPPVVIMAPGLDSVKEELQATAEYLLQRGLAVLAVDGPGQGETEFELPIEPAYERVTSSVVDYLEKRADIDPGRIGMYGVSMGGYYAARSAAYEPRLRATIDLSGLYRFDWEWDTLPPQTRAAFERRSGSASPEEARKRSAAITLEEAAPHVTSPLLVVHGRRDRIAPPHHARHLAADAPGAQLVMYPEGNHGITDQPFASRSMMGDWLANHLASQ